MYTGLIAGIAQLVERLLCKQGVGSSSLSAGTNHADISGTDLNFSSLVHSRSWTRNQISGAVINTAINELVNAVFK